MPRQRASTYGSIHDIEQAAVDHGQEKTDGQDTSHIRYLRNPWAGGLGEAQVPVEQRRNQELHATQHHWNDQHHGQGRRAPAQLPYQGRKQRPDQAGLSDHQRMQCDRQCRRKPRIALDGGLQPWHRKRGKQRTEQPAASEGLPGTRRRNDRHQQRHQRDPGQPGQALRRHGPVQQQCTAGSQPQAAGESAPALAWRAHGVAVAPARSIARMPGPAD